MRPILPLALTLAVFAIPSLAQAEQRNATVTRQTLVRRQPNDNAEVLGHLREGKAIRVTLPDRQGWYAVSFGKPIKGATVGWIAAADLLIADPATPQAQSAARGGRPAPRRREPVEKLKPSWFDFSLGLYRASPSVYQLSILEEAAGLTALSYGLAYGHRLQGSSLGFVFELSYYKVSGTGTLNGGIYTAKGFGGSAGLDLLFVEDGTLMFSGLASLGMTVSSVSNTTSALELNTTNITAFPIRLELDLRKYFGVFGFLVSAGYQIHNLKEVPVVLPDASNTEAVSDLNLGGLYGRLGFSLNFD